MYTITDPENRVFRSSAGLGSGVLLSCPICAFCPAAMSLGRTGRTCHSSPLRASLWPETRHILFRYKSDTHTTVRQHMEIVRILMEFLQQ